MTLSLNRQGATNNEGKRCLWPSPILSGSARRALVFWLARADFFWVLHQPQQGDQLRVPCSASHQALLLLLAATGHPWGVALLSQVWVAGKTHLTHRVLMSMSDR